MYVDTHLVPSDEAVPSLYNSMLPPLLGSSGLPACAQAGKSSVIAWVGDYRNPPRNLLGKPHKACTFSVNFGAYN